MEEVYVGWNVLCIMMNAPDLINLQNSIRQEGGSFNKNIMKQKYEIGLTYLLDQVEYIKNCAT